MQIARWGKSLAVRIPAQKIKELALKEGDKVEIDLKVVAQTGADHDQVRAAAINRLMNMPRFLPENFQFNREEANER